MDAYEEKIAVLCGTKDELVSTLKKAVCCIGNGPDNSTLAEVGQLADAVKDLAEAEKLCHEAKYFEEVSKAMREYEDPNSYGYRNGRMLDARDIKDPLSFRERGMLTTPPLDFYTDPVTGELGRYGYNNGNGSRSGRGNNNGNTYNGSATRTGNGNGNYGHHPYMNGEWEYNGAEYSPESMRKARLYENWKNAKKHYTQSRNEEDGVKMNEYIEENTMETIGSMREMWDDANPETKRKMKANLTSFVSEMKI